MKTNIAMTATVVADAKYFPATELKKAFCSLRLVHSDRTFEKETNQWVDGEPSWFSANVFGKMAQNCQYIKKGDRVIVIGTLSTETYLAQGEETERSKAVISVDAIGKSLEFENATSAPATATVAVEDGQDPWEVPAGDVPF